MPSIASISEFAIAETQASGGSPGPSGMILLQNGDALLLQNGDHLLLQNDTGGEAIIPIFMHYYAQMRS